MSSGMFRGKESSNRIELSRLVQDLMNFGGFGSLWCWGWGWVDWGGDGLGCPPHMCTHMCTHAHACVVNIIISCKWLLPLDFWGIPGNSLLCHTCMCVHAHTCECVCGGHPLTTPHPSTHPPLPGGTLGITQNSIVLELIKIFQFCLKI